LTANPKTGVVGCYLQIFQLNGCGVVQGNNYYAYPFDGTTIGSKVTCAMPVGGNYGAVTIACD
jgi:hypothetical protein